MSLLSWWSEAGVNVTMMCMYLVYFEINGRLWNLQTTEHDGQALIQALTGLWRDDRESVVTVSDGAALLLLAGAHTVTGSGFPNATGDVSERVAQLLEEHEQHGTMTVPYEANPFSSGEFQ